MPGPIALARRRTRALDVVLTFGVSRAVIAAIGVVAAVAFLNLHGLAALDLGTVWKKWDVLWYERVAIHGYAWHTDQPEGQAVAGFFPLYPLIVALGLRILPALSFFTLGTVLSNVCTFAALWLIAYDLATDEAHARQTLLVMVTAAGSFYFSIPYTEGLFLLLVAAVMVLSRRRYFLLAAILAGFAAVTRVQGFALVLVPLVACGLDGRLSTRARAGTLIAMVAVAVCPVAVYMAYLSDVQGSAQAFISRQAMWGNAWPYPLKSIVGLVLWPSWLSGWVHGAFWLLYVALLVRYWRRLLLGDALFCAAALLISTQQESFHGIYRYVAPLVPLALAIGSDRIERRFAIIAINLVFGAIMILAFVMRNRLAV